MSEPVQTEIKPAATYQVRSMVASELPAERTYPLSSDEFQTFCDGENSNAKSGMYFCIGLFVSAVVGLFSLFENADWASFWARQRGMLLVYFAALLVIAAGSVTGSCICLYRLCKENTAYTRLKGRIDRHFKNPVTVPSVLAQGAEALPEPADADDAHQEPPGAQNAQ